MAKVRITPKNSRAARRAKAAKTFAKGSRRNVASANRSSAW